MEEDCVVSQYSPGIAHFMVQGAPRSMGYLYAIYAKVGNVYAPFTPNRLHYHHKLVARFTLPETVTNL